MQVRAAMSLQSPIKKKKIAGGSSSSGGCFDRQYMGLMALQVGT